MRPDVTREGRHKVVAIALTDASSYYSPPDEDLLRTHIKKVGKTNVPYVIQALIRLSGQEQMEKKRNVW